MKITEPSYYQLQTDRELLQLLSDMLADKKIISLRDLATKMKDSGLDSFSGLREMLVKNGDLALAAAGENLLERLHRLRPAKKAVLKSSREVGLYLSDRFLGQKQESFVGLYLNSENRIIAEKELFRGTLNHVDIHPREIMRWAVLFSANSLIVAHNHPSGNLLPSAADLETTSRLQKACQLLRLNLLDHFIVGGGSYLSFREQDLV